MSAGGTGSRPLEGRVALVTGGAQAAGRAYVLGLAGAGAKVVVADRFPEPGEETVRLAEKAGGTARFVHTDVTDEASVAAAVGAAVDSYGGLDVLVNNAATYGATSFAPLTELSTEKWDTTMAVFVKGPWLAAKAAVPHLARSEHAVIVNHTSVAAYGVKQWLDYGVARGAVVSMTKSMAQELAPLGIRVNAIAAGSSGIEAVALGVIDDEAKMYETADFKRQLIPRLCADEDLAGALLYLAGDASSYVVGQTIVVDGGKFFLG